MNRRLARFGYPASTRLDSHAESLLRALGAESVRSLDISTYEGASDLVDLTQPIPETMRQNFSPRALANHRPTAGTLQL